MAPVLCLVTDRRQFGGEDALVHAVALAAAAGVHLVQVREKDLEAGALVRLVERCVSACRGHRTRVLVNDRLDVALAAGAHGVHLPGDGVPAARLRRVAPPAFLIGRSVHSVNEAMEAAAGGGLDYLVFGTVFPTGSKPGVAPAGVGALREVARSVPVPVLAIGGLTIARMGEAAAAGAAGAAAIGLFADAAVQGQETVNFLVKTATLAFDTPPVDT